MLCEHLAALEQELLAAGIPVTYRGRAWSQNCREWVYFDCWLDRDALRARLALPDCVQNHDHRGTHDGRESGLECTLCHDGIMGAHTSDRDRCRTFG